MKCINRIISLILIINVLMLSGCGLNSYRLPYSYDTKLSAYSFSSASSSDMAQPFAGELCVTDHDTTEVALDMSLVTAAGLFDVNGSETMYAKNVHKPLNPASLTKVMTAMIALKYGKLDDELTASSNVYITESGAQLVGFKEGDRLTLDQALHALLMYSGNDAAIVIAEYISGSVDSFVELMNNEALQLGATNTNFTNPHGLTDDAHITTAYDLYLIFNEAIKYEKFREIIHMTEYSSTYKDKDGNIKELNFSNTNLYLSGVKYPPANVNVIGGKTGTTNAAGACLVLLSNDASGNPYISVILQATDRDSLYDEMNILLMDVD